MGKKKGKEEVKSVLLTLLMKYSCGDATFVLGIDRHFEGVLSKINFSDIDPLAVDVVLVDVVASNGYACTMKLNV